MPAGYVWSGLVGPGKTLSRLVMPGQPWWDLVGPGGTLSQLIMPGQAWWYLVRLMGPGQAWWDLFGPGKVSQQVRPGLTRPDQALPAGNTPGLNRAAQTFLAS